MTPTEVLQSALALEHSTLYLYGVMGARISQSQDPALFEALTHGHQRHRARRDRLRLLVTEAGATPVAAEIAYPVPDHWNAPKSISAGGVDLEQGSQQAMAAVVASTTGDTRTWAATELTWSAHQAIVLGGSPEIWPGAPELG